MTALLRGMRLLLQSSIQTVKRHYISVIETLLFLVDVYRLQVADGTLIFSSSLRVYNIPYPRPRHSDISPCFRIATTTFMSVDHTEYLL
jgi:hypothetical protein